MEKLYKGCYHSLLDSGTKVIVEQRPKRPLSLGLWVKVGSRNDPKDKSGLAHFLEHLLFKGTKHRSSFQISEEIDALGGNINGLTHKEYTLIYVNVLSKHLQKAFDVLGDLLVNPLFRPEDIETERGVVLQEIKSREDNPQERIFDLFTQTVWPDSNPLSRPVMGSEESVATITQGDLLQHHKFYNSQNLVLVAVGDVDLGHLEQLADRKFKGLKTSESKLLATSSSNLVPSFQVEEKDILQTHLCLGFEGIAMSDERRFALEALNAIFGSGMSSRLFRRIREELGLVYSISSHTTYYQDTGLVRVYSTTKGEDLEEVVEIILEEAKKLAEEPIDRSTLKRAKEKLKGNFLLGMEGSFPRMMRLGASYIYERKLMSVDKVVKRVNRIKPEQLEEVANEVFKDPSLVLIGPHKEKLLKLESTISVG